MTSLRMLGKEASRALLSPITSGRAAEWFRPTIAAVYLTKKCNSKCNFCDFWKQDRDPGELTSEQWGVVFSRLKAFGVEYVGVNASGEMFTRPDIFDILTHLKDLGLRFAVNSNALTLGERNAKRLAAIGPTQVTVGMDGVGNEAYLNTRGLKNGFEKVSRNFDHMLAAGINKLSIGSVLMAENIDQWVPLAEFALKKGLDGVRFTAHHEDYFTASEEPTVPAYAQPAFLQRVDENIEKLIALKRKTGIVKNSAGYLRRVTDFYANPKEFFPEPCLQGSNRIELDVRGNVTLCSFVTDSLGNLVEQEMEEIWQSAVHRRARQDAYEGNCPHCYLSCYGEENLRLSKAGFVPSLGSSIKRGYGLLGPKTPSATPAD